MMRVSRVFGALGPCCLAWVLLACGHNPGSPQGGSGGYRGGTGGVLGASGGGDSAGSGRADGGFAGAPAGGSAPAGGVPSSSAGFPSYGGMPLSSAGFPSSGGVPSPGGAGTASGGMDSSGGVPAGGALSPNTCSTGAESQCRIGLPGPELWGTASIPSATAFGDLDGDGLLDMIVAGKPGNHTVGALSVFMGTPGGFTCRRDFDTGGGPSSVGIVDLDGDGDLDVALANDGGSSAVSILLNEGRGSLAQPRGYPGCSYAVSIAIRDLNGDSMPDLAVACWLNSTIDVFVNIGHGTFAPKRSYRSEQPSWGPSAVAAGDVDGDGDADLVAADALGDRVSVLKNQGDGTLSTPVHYPATGRAQGIALGDLDGDGKLDIALASRGANGLDVLLNQGNGAFGTARSFEMWSYTYSPSSVVLGDIDGDGRLDAALASDNGTGVAVTFRNQGNGSFVADSSFIDLPGEGKSVNLLDVNMDGHLDLVVGVTGVRDTSNASVAIFPGLGGGSFATLARLTTNSLPCNAVTTGDFDGDGKVDIAAADCGSVALNIFYNHGDGNFTQVVKAGCSSSTALAAGDFNGDGRADLVDLCGGPNRVAVMLAQPNHTFAATYYEAAPYAQLNSFLTDASIADLDGDGDRDFVVANRGSSAIHVFLNAGNGSFPAQVDYMTAKTPQRIAIGDLDGSGSPDVAFTGLDTGVSIYANDGKGSLTFKADIPTGNDPLGLAIADLDGDLANDVVVANSDFNVYNNSTASILMNIGNFTFKRKDFTLREDPNSVSVADLNGDRRPDIVVGNDGGNVVSVLINRGGENFDTSAWPVGPGLTSTAIGDFNSDGRLDVTVAFRRGIGILQNHECNLLGKKLGR